ncbi:MAG: hypothetical protein HDQ98_09165 [Lachnospiraceae bacterium]|nr:hypothetical protein [Lachnospiraceae bacterium]
MRRDDRRIRLLVCILMLALTGAFTGCGSKADTAGIGGKSTDRALSRAEYIGMLGDSFGYDSYISETDLFSDVSSSNEYYSVIQAAAEWQIIDGGGVFEPEKPATIGFALESAVRAIGTDDIAASGAAIDLNDLAEFYVNNIAQIDLSDLEVPIDADTARQIIEYAKSYDFQLVLPQITEMEFVEGVKTAGMGIRLNADGATGVLFADEGYRVGDIVYLDATDESLARAIKITGIEGETFTFEDAPIEDTYAYLNIQGTFDGKVVEAVSASEGTYVGLGQEIYDEMSSYQMSFGDEEYTFVELANSAKVDNGGDHIVFTANFDVQRSAALENRSALNYSNLPEGVSRPDYNNNGNMTASANGQLVVGIKNIKVNVKYESSEWYRPLNPKMVELQFRFDTEVSSEIHGSVAASIPLGEVYIQVWGPLNIKLMLTAHLGADGNVSISYTTENVMRVGWRKGAGLGRSFDSKANANVEADATLTADATLLADLRIGFKKVSYSVTNAQVTCGATAVAKIEEDLFGDQPTCLDLQLYVPLKWGVNQVGCIITDINRNWKHSGVIWDSSSSPVKIHRHLEDWQRTPGDVCTRKEAVEQELVTPEGEPLEEINPFEFELLEFDFIELVSYVMYLGEGESMRIGFDSIPDGYTQDDLMYEVLDPAVCSVSDGTVQGRNAGSTIVLIRTGDGMFMVRLAVTVNEDYSIDGFQRL